MVRGNYMGRRYQNEDADVSASDYGVPEKEQGMSWDEFENLEADEKIMSEREIF